MKKILGILGVAVFAITLFMNSNSINEKKGGLDLASLTTVNSANAEVVIGSDNCVCKPNDSNRCLASNFISYRTKCGTGATDSDCEAQQTSYPWGGTFCTDVG